MRAALALPLVLASLMLVPAAAQDQPLPAPRREAPRIIPRTEPDQPLPQPRKPLTREELLKAMPKKAPQPPAAATKPPLPTEPKARLEALFSRLHGAENALDARKTEKEIERMFERSGSDTADLTFTRATKALATKDFDTALDLLDYTLILRPHFAEGYHRRAQVHLLRKDEEAALRDLRTSLALEPRHFMALATFAGLLQSSGNKKAAYKVLTRLKELHPHFPEIGEVLEKLRPDVEGQAI